jgi:hypothetical protein
MKKLFLIIGLFLAFACTQDKDITQKVGYDNMTNSYSVTTSFTYPSNYSACVYCGECKIDSVKRAEMIKAFKVQQTMIEKN